MMDIIVGNLVREGINKHRARELAEHFIKYTTPPQRKPLYPREVKDVLRATGYVTNSQAWELAEEVMKLLAAHGIKE